MIQRHGKIKAFLILYCLSYGRFFMDRSVFARSFSDKAIQKICKTYIPQTVPEF
jgi:hypothetical protein